LPELVGLSAPFDSKLIGSLRGDFNLFDVLRVNDFPKTVAGRALK
jgi:hypothetical protein